MKLSIVDLLQPPFGLGLFVDTIPAVGINQLPNVPDSMLPSIPSSVRNILAALSVEELHMAEDEQAIVYFGKVQLLGDGLVENAPVYKAPSGHFIEPGDLGFQFRITFPRIGSVSIGTSINALSNDPDASDLKTMLNRLGGTGAGSIPSDFPNKNFRIELLFNSIILHLPKKDYLPARLAADGWLERDTTLDEVTIHLPKIAMIITQNADDYGETDVSFDGWGISSMDDQFDKLAGEAIAMKPPLCLHKSNVVGFGLEKVVLDLSRDFTPTEILEKNFGVGDEFKGLWMPQVRFFLAPYGLKGKAFDTWGQDLLIDFDQGLSGEIGAELVNNTNRAPLEVDVVFYEGKVRKSPTKKKDEVNNNNTTRESFINTLNDAEIQLRIRGGKAPYSITVKRDNTTITPTPFEGDQNRLRYPLGATGAGKVKVSIRVEDSLTPTKRFWQENIEVTFKDSLIARGKTSQVVQDAELTPQTSDDGFSIVLAPEQKDDNAILVQTQPDFGILKANGNEVLRRSDGTYRIPVTRGGPQVNLEASWSGTQTELFKEYKPTEEVSQQRATPGENTVSLQFSFQNPKETENLDTYVNNFFNNTGVRTRLKQFLDRRSNRSVDIYGYASYEKKDDKEHEDANKLLSERRAEVLKRLLTKIDSSSSGAISIKQADGTAVAKAHNREPKDNDYFAGVATYGAPLPIPPKIAKVTVFRPQDEEKRTPSPADPSPGPEEPKRPSAFRRIAVKVRFQRNRLVFMELFGEFDVKDETKESGKLIQNNASGNGTETTDIASKVTSTPEASGAAKKDQETTGNVTPENQGVLDFRISMLYDVATERLTQTLAVGFDKNNVKDGFVFINKFTPEPLANTMASLLLFAPLIQGGIEAVQKANSDGERTEAMIIAGAEIAVATTLGLFAIKMERITLFGAELSFTEISPNINLFNAEQITDVGMLLDYAVDFKVDLNLFNLLTIKTKDADASGKPLNPPRARYKAIGFNLNFDQITRDVKYQPIFDTSKGYELSLGDPGALEVKVGSTSLNNLLRILTARLSRENPLTFEADLALNVNLGIITVDTVRVRLRIFRELDPVKVVPEIIPTKVSVNIPAALSGTGYLDFGNSSSPGTVPGTSGGFQGFVDITVIPVKLRIAAAVGIKPINEDGREATAFFLGLEVELPAAIPLLNTGLGIYGFLGLFAMHYERKEPAQIPGQLPPALSWFYQTVHGNVIDIQNGWQPKLDKWSFGLGIVLGTMEGGFVLNLKGMFILELPGPRILILVKASLLFPKPKDVKKAGQNESAGILAVIDLDFNLGRLTIGFIIEYNIEKVLSLRIPVVSGFSFDNPKDWFVDLGNHIVPAEALILGIARGYAYLMIHGNGIPNWPKPGDFKLTGFSIALGLGASLVFGKKSSGLYLEVRGDLAAGVSFSPLHFFGLLELTGQLHLWIVSISAEASLEVEGPSPHTYIHGKACGKVSFFFFSVKGCVNIEINSPISIQPPPDLLISLTLVSRSSALMEGQGVDRPIDGALGKAAVSASDPVPTVPIDSIPVLNLFATPLVDASIDTFLDTPFKGAQSTITQDGWVSIGAKVFVRYQVTRIQLNQPLLENSKPKPANFWKKPTDKPGDDESGVDLALLCWSPDPTPRAVQRSKELTKTITDRWEIVCKQIAPATSVFYTFNQKPLGFNDAGWMLNGIAFPDPPDTIRSKPADTEIFVFENQFPVDLPGITEAWLAIRNSIVTHAKVIGAQDPEAAQRFGRVLQLPFESFAKDEQGLQPSLPPETIDAIKQFEAENILIDSDELSGAEIFLCLSQKVTPEDVLVRTLDKDFSLISEKTISATGFTDITQPSDLPPNWIDVGSPWALDLAKVWFLLDSIDKGKNNLRRIVLHFKGEPKMRYIMLVVKRNHPLPAPPDALLCAIECLTAAEFQREEHDTQTQQSDNDQLSDALEGEPLRALLKPNTTYELSVEYQFQRKNEKGLIDDDFVNAPARTFTFKTDANAPQRLDPWVLFTTPQNDMRYHFKDDPVQIYLNDESAIQLFKAYGITLIAKVLKANGAHPVVDPPKMTLDLSNITQVKKIKAAVMTPYLHTLEEVVNENLPCINDSGEREEHVVFTIGVDLLLNTEYTVEIAKQGDIIDPNSNTYRTPLYKIAFRTSRYASAEQFAGFITSAYSSTRLMKDNLAVLNPECSDAEMQTALLNAGLPAIPATDNIAISVLWSSKVVGGTLENKLEGILIDTPEPLWRKRPYPATETIIADSGDVKHWVMTDKLELELFEASDTSVVARISHTVGGSRTIVYLTPDAKGKPIHLQLKKHIFTHVEQEYGQAGHFEEFDALNLTLPSLAPWEEED
jgi:large repetitive protein